MHRYNSGTRTGAAAAAAADTAANIDKDKDAVQLEALQTLINCVGNGQLPTHQTLPLAQRILSSSIAQTTSSSLVPPSSSASASLPLPSPSPSPHLSASLVKKIQRHYSKNTNASPEEVRGVISNVENLYRDFVATNTNTNTNTTSGEDVAVMNNTLKILSRLAGTGRNLNLQQQQQRQQNQQQRQSSMNYRESTNRNGLKKRTFTLSRQNEPHETNEQNEQNKTPLPHDHNHDNNNHDNNNNHDHRTFKHVQMALYDEEQTILRECIHALQHIDGDIIRFHSNCNSNCNSNMNSNNDDSEDEHEHENENVINNDNKTMTIQIRDGLLPFEIMAQNPSQMVEHRSTRLLSSGSKDALHVCCEAGWLYSRIMNYVHFARGQSRVVGGQVYGRGDRRGDRRGQHVGVGVVPRALASAFMKELELYHALLSSLENQLLVQTKKYRNNDHDDHDSDNGSGSGSENKSKGLTCRQLMMQLRTPITQLRTMAMMIDGIDPHLNGGQLLTALYLHSIHGDVRHVELVNRILYSTSLPWYDLLYDWCMNGVLLTSSSSSSSSSSLSPSKTSATTIEFFIQENMNSSSDDVWHGQYTLHKDQIPSLPSIGGGNGGLLSESLANEILIVGKGINFIRKCLHDSKWSLDVQRLIPQKELEKFIKGAKLSRSVTNNVELFQEIKKLLGFHYDSVVTTSTWTSRRLVRDLSGQCGEIITQSPLERTVAGAAQQVHKHILLSLFEQHHLLQHLQGLKEILFLGQGDFICSLMDGLHVEFESMGNEGIDGIYMHNMMGILHDALRSTNAKFLPQFVLQRVYVKLLSPKDMKGQRFWIDADQKAKEKLDGWDIFSLEYVIDAPLTAVVHPSAMNKYYQVFNLLFRLKRIEWMLNSTWRQSTVLNHALQCMISKYGDMTLGASSSIKRGNEIARMKRLLRTFSLTRQMMLHFVTNLQSYLMFEVLESGWKSLVSKLGNATTLDEVISSHDEYLDEIVAKSLLAETIGSETKKDTDELGRQLRLVLTIAYRFCKVHEKIFSEALQSIDNAAERQRGAERRSKAGKWGFDKIDPDVEGQHFYNLSNEDTLKDILGISQNFDLSLRKLLSMLNEKVNGTIAETVLTSPSQSPYVLNSSEESLAQNDDSLRFLTFRLDFSEYYS